MNNKIVLFYEEKGSSDPLLLQAQCSALDKF